jgi:hypothetical protein
MRTPSLSTMPRTELLRVARHAFEMIGKLEDSKNRQSAVAILQLQDLLDAVVLANDERQAVGIIDALDRHEIDLIAAANNSTTVEEFRQNECASAQNFARTLVSPEGWQWA